MENKNGSFAIHKLPNPAQISSINQIIAKDFNKDGHLDIVMAGNLYSSEVETPRNDAGIGLYMEGNGKGGFTPYRAFESGLFIEGDTKDLALIEIKGKTYIIAGKNDDYLQFIHVNKN